MAEETKTVLICGIMIIDPNHISLLRIPSNEINVTSFRVNMARIRLKALNLY